LSEQIYRQVRELIVRRAAPPNAPLPSSRTLAIQLEVSRATVIAAFEQLRNEGYVRTRHGAPTRVADPLPDALAPPPAGRTVESASLPPLSRRGAAVRETIPFDPAVTRTARPFRAAVPALDLFPVASWERIASVVLRRTPAQSLGYGDPRGTPALRRAIAGYLRTARGLDCGPEEILVTAGSQQALALAVQALTDPGDQVWIEDPGYFAARGAVLAGGAVPVPVPVDAHGLLVATGRRRAPRARLAVVTASRHMPLGVSLSAGRRDELLTWANQAGAWVVDDDYAGEFRFAPGAAAPLRADPAGHHVLHAGTFSKVLFPALRIGYLVGPASLIESLGRIRFFQDMAPPYLEQAILTVFIEKGHFERHVRRVLTAYRGRQAMLRDELVKGLRGIARVDVPDGGMHLVVWLPRHWSEGAVLREAATIDLELTALADFCLETRFDPGLVLGFSGLREDEIRDGARALVRLLGRMAGSTRGHG
jgi:GntR family transcriptional regulator/MocR family aminotransferase